MINSCYKQQNKNVKQEVSQRAELIILIAKISNLPFKKLYKYIQKLSMTRKIQYIKGIFVC